MQSDMPLNKETKPIQGIMPKRNTYTNPQPISLFVFSSIYNNKYYNEYVCMLENTNDSI